MDLLIIEINIGLGEAVGKIRCRVWGAYPLELGHLNFILNAMKSYLKADLDFKNILVIEFRGVGGGNGTGLTVN